MKALYSDDCRFLSDNEILYQVTNSKQDASRFNGILLRGDAVSLDEVLENLTPARKMLAVSVIELYHRLQQHNRQITAIRNSQDAHELMKASMTGLQTEECWVIALNSASRLIRKTRVSVGGYTSTSVDVRVILRELLQVRAVGCILVHNHPSGSTRPSLEDDRLTTTMQAALKAVNIRLLDHLIFTDDNFYSYADEGRL